MSEPRKSPGLIRGGAVKVDAGLAVVYISDDNCFFSDGVSRDFGENKTIKLIDGGTTLCSVQPLKCEPLVSGLRIAGTIMASTVKESGPWSAGVVESDGRTYVESSDFTHDARMYVTGDFESAEQKLEYAQEIARRLNAWQAHCLRGG